MQICPRELAPEQHALFAGNIPSIVCTSVNHQHIIDMPSFVGEPPYTNYRKEWKGTLDYIMSVKDQRIGTPPPATSSSSTSIPTNQWILARRRVLQIPSSTVLGSRVALPNDAFGSDHIR
jgi:hypothetical protein